jgi:hypothetical protein
MISKTQILSSKITIINHLNVREISKIRLIRKFPNICFRKEKVGVSNFDNKQ